MADRNLAWNASNASRFHPLDESATLLDDLGARPPLQIITDLKLLVPEDAGQYVYIGGLTVTPNIVTIIFMASDSLTEDGNLVASISQRLPVSRFFPCAISPQVDGAGGWISFGDIKDVSYKGRFTTPSQTLLSPLAARRYRVPPIPSVRALGGSELTGLVKLIGGNDIEVVKECRSIPNHAVPSYHEDYCGGEEGTIVRNVIVVRLKDKSGAAAKNVLDTYKGPCGKRPTTRTCGSPEPVEFIGATAPDCNGNITIRLQGCIDVLGVQQLVTLDENGAPVLSEEATGAILSCSTTVEDACIETLQLPDSEGRLPNEYDSQCTDESVSSVSEGDGDSAPFSFDGAGASAAESAFGSSVSESFDVIDDWVVHFGNFTQSGITLTGGLLSRNIATYEPASPPSGFYKKAVCHVKLVAGPSSSLHNACVVANYQTDYFVAEIDWDGHYRGFKMFRIARFDGARWINIYAVPVPVLRLGDTYSVSLSVIPHEDTGKAWLVGNLVGVTNPGIDIEIGPVAVSNYTAGTGYFGIGCNRSAAEFSLFKIESVTSSP
jgi:hypothetical protein